MRVAHDSLFGGHSGVKKTEDQIQPNFIWPGLHKDVTSFCRSCNVCLALVDYATRYPEAVPLKNIDTEMVAEALLDMYRRVGVPEEVLSDVGTQFTSDCMKEVSRLLSIRRLTTSPYHSACNELAKKCNGTLKRMLKKVLLQATTSVASFHKSPLVCL